MYHGRWLDRCGSGGCSSTAGAMIPAAAQDNPADTSFAAIAARMKAIGAPAASSADAGTNEVGQAVSVATAYFEDTLETAPAVLLSAGPMGAERLTAVLDELSAGMGMGAVGVQEMVSRQMLGEGAASAGLYGGIPLGWLAGVRGALAN